MWEDPSRQMRASGQTEGHLDTFDLLKKVCVFLGILEVVAMSALCCWDWVFVKEQMEHVHPGDLKGLGETIQGYITAFL